MSHTATAPRALKLELATETLPLAAPFRIAGHVFTATTALIVTLSDGEHVGRGEAAGVFFLGEGVPEMTEAILAARAAIEAGVTREGLAQLLPRGGARNAVDCALWELEARQAGRPVWELAGLSDPVPLTTTFTLGADDPERMAAAALSVPDARAIKVKLTGELDLDVDRVNAIRSACPDVWLGVDANQGYRFAQLDALMSAMVKAAVSLIEQPLPRGREVDLRGYKSPIPLAADESALGLADVDGLAGCFDVINIKLDKCGGLTEGLAMAERAREQGMQVMVGNMVGSSLATAPAFLLGQLCDIVDLDGPFLLAQDRSPGVEYRDGMIHCSDEVWGGASPHQPPRS